MKIKHTMPCLEMNRILKNIPCKIYYAGMFLVVMMFLFLFFMNHFIQYERTIKFPIQIIVQKSSCQAKILVDSSYINYFHKGDEFVIKLEHITNDSFLNFKVKVQQVDSSRNVMFNLPDRYDYSLLFLYGTCRPYVEFSVGYEKLIDIIKMSFVL